MAITVDMKVTPTILSKDEARDAIADTLVAYLWDIEQRRLDTVTALILDRLRLVQVSV